MKIQNLLTKPFIIPKVRLWKKQSISMMTKVAFQFRIFTLMTEALLRKAKFLTQKTAKKIQFHTMTQLEKFLQNACSDMPQMEL